MHPAAHSCCLIDADAILALCCRDTSSSLQLMITASAYASSAAAAGANKLCTCLRKATCYRKISKHSCPVGLILIDAASFFVITTIMKMPALRLYNYAGRRSYLYVYAPIDTPFFILILTPRSQVGRLFRDLLHAIWQLLFQQQTLEQQFICCLLPARRHPLIVCTSHHVDCWQHHLQERKPGQAGCCRIGCAAVGAAQSYPTHQHITHSAERTGLPGTRAALLVL